MSNRTETKPCTLNVNLPLSFSSMSNRTVTKHSFVKYIEINCFSSMSNRTVTKPCTLKVNLPLSFSTMSNRTVTKPRHGPAPDLLALASG